MEKSRKAPIYWPYKHNHLSFRGDYSLKLSQEIYNFLLDEERKNKFVDFMLKRKLRTQKRNLDMYFSLFGITDKLYFSDLSNKYSLNKERVRQIISKITRQLMSYVYNHTDKKFSEKFKYAISERVDIQ